MFDDGFPLWLKLIIVLVCIFIGWLIYSSVTSEKIVLTKTAWNCTESRQELLIIQQVGKVGVPMYQTVCTQYRRK